MEFIRKYKASLVVVVAMMGAAVGLAVLGQESTPKGPHAEAARINEAIPAAAELKDLALKYDARIAALEQQLTDSRKGVQGLQEALAALTGMIEDLKKPAESLKPTPPPPPAPGRILSLEVSANPNAPPSLRVPAGSFGEATLLTGVYAPVTGDALPVLIRLDAMLTGPNRSRVPVQQCLLLGKAVGDANTSRAIIQLSSMSLVAPDGKTYEQQINGYVADADGIQGLQGEYIWNAKQLVGLSILSGASIGAAGALGQGQTTVFTGPAGAARQVTGDTGLFVASSSAAKAFENVGKIIEDRLKEFVPAIYVTNRARRVTVVFLQGVTLQGLPAATTAPRSNLGGFDR
jgi:hypothetical protein